MFSEGVRFLFMCVCALFLFFHATRQAFPYKTLNTHAYKITQQKLQWVGKYPGVT